MTRYVLFLLTLVALAFAPGAAAETSVFTATGFEQTFQVPAGVTQLTVTAVGAQGASSGGAAGGRGAVVTAGFAVTPLQTLYMEVGTAGTGAGFNGGGSPRGGGASDVRTLPASGVGTLDSRIAVAAGGGGAGANFAGKDADTPNPANPAGGGTATQSAGGNGRDGGATGGPGQGGSGIAGGGGGGGGLFGGGGGGNDGILPLAGGGGSSKVPVGGTRALATAGTAASVTINWSPAVPAQPGGPATGSPPAVSDTVKPALTRLELSPSVFTAGKRGGSVVARAGTRLTYRVSEAATTSFTVQRTLKGRKKGKKCKAGRKKGKRCTIYKPVRGSFSHRDVAGANTLRFTGRMRGRALEKGRYRLKAVSKDTAGNKSRAVYRSFRIK